MQPAPEPIPDETSAREIFQRHFAEEILALRRFPTGLCHYVYEVSSPGASRVVRIASPATRDYMQGGLYWQPILEAAGVPVAPVLFSGEAGPFLYAILPRLPGADLGQVYPQLTRGQKQVLAGQMAGVQRSLTGLPAGRRYGYAFSYEALERGGLGSWAEVVRASLERSRGRLARVGRIDPLYAARLERLLARRSEYFARVAPTPFLDDTTTKNVIIDNGRLAGIVDTDNVCFGDRLFTLGLTQMALLSQGADTEYIEFWLEALAADAQQRRVVQLYTLLFCLDFMSELGQVFNQEIPFEQPRAQQLSAIFETLAAGLGE